MATLRFDIRSSGQTATVATGDRLELRLDENPSTGFRWHIDSDGTPILILEKDTFTRLLGGASGSGGTRDLVFRVAKEGQTVLQASYRRSWETQKPPHETFEMTVVAK